MSPVEVLGKTLFPYEVRRMKESPAIYMVNNTGLPWFEYNFQDRQWERIPSRDVRVPLFRAPASPAPPEVQRDFLLNQLETIGSPKVLFEGLTSIEDESVFLARRQLEIALRVEEAISSSPLDFVACCHEYPGYSAALLALPEPPMKETARNPVWLPWITRRAKCLQIQRRSQWEHLLAE